jgi:hypothetical protein
MILKWGEKYLFLEQNCAKLFQLPRTEIVLVFKSFSQHLSLIKFCSAILLQGNRNKDEMRDDYTGQKCVIICLILTEYRVEVEWNEGPQGLQTSTRPEK